MKTGTLTFHSPNNNGSFLQAYAMQKVLIEAGYENEIIDYYSFDQVRQYSIFRAPRNVGDFIRNAISLLHYGQLSHRYNVFQRLRKEHLQMSRHFDTCQEALAVIDDYDAIICGSDQIWNTRARDFSDIYLLPGIGKKKITYAVSCGSHIEDVDQELVIKYAKDFKALSVREEALFNFFKQNGVDKVRTVLDPTLLLKKEDYKPLYSKNAIITSKYIFLYTINYSNEVLKNAKRIAHILGLPVYAAFTGYSAYKCKMYGIKVIYDMTPDVFLNLIDNASYVFTNSFHGTAFSIIFRKNFYRLCEMDDYGKNIIDDRIDNILGKLDLKNVNCNLNDSIENKEVDYSNIEAKLASMIEESKKYLIDALKDE